MNKGRWEVNASHDSSNTNLRKVQISSKSSTHVFHLLPLSQFFVCIHEIMNSYVFNSEQTSCL